MAAAPVLPASSAPTPQPAPLSQGARIIDTFVAPSKTFTDLRRSASWWAPWILIALTALLMAYAMGKQVGFEQISKSQIEHSKRADQFDKLPADQQAAQLRITSKIMAGASYSQPVSALAILPDRNRASLVDVQSSARGRNVFWTGVRDSDVRLASRNVGSNRCCHRVVSRALIRKDSTSTILSEQMSATTSIPRRLGASYAVRRLRSMSSRSGQSF